LLLLLFFWHDSSPSSATQRKHLGYDGKGDTQKREAENPRGVRRRHMTTDDDFGDGDEKRMRSVDVNFSPLFPTHDVCG
jgi:hypothetical protein